MRIAVKYSMDDVQAAIANVIHLIPLPPSSLGIGTAILRLAFVAEFQNHFFQDVAIEVFTEASSIVYQPTADHIARLMPYPDFVALMMEYREGLRNPETAPWRKQWISEDNWLVEQFRRFGFKFEEPSPNEREYV